KKRGFWGVLEH
ncbi:hypothetical protein HPF75_1214, partial [Helicobacter pylori]